MSYTNHFRDVLKQDDARAHWDAHVLTDLGQFRTMRQARAKANGLTYEEQLDTEFAAWHLEKKLGGFDNFDTSPLGQE